MLRNLTVDDSLSNGEGLAKESDEALYEANIVR